MKRIAVISSDKVLGRAVALALECSAAGRRSGAVLMPAGEADAGAEKRGRGERIEVVALAADGALRDDVIGRCDIVVVVGAAGFVSGRLSAGRLHNCGRRPEIFVVSWQHNEQTVLGLIESGIDQYMTLPLSLRRLCLKIVNRH